MAPSTIRQALGAMKDQTSISLAKVSSNVAPELDVAIIKATSHDDEPSDEKYFREIHNLTSYSRPYVNACVSTISKRLGKTRDWIVALKALMLVHRLLNDGDRGFQQEFSYATRRGTRLLNMSDFRDEAHSHSWDQSAFVRTYSLYLDQRLEWIVYENKQSDANNNQRERRSDNHGEEYENNYSYSDNRDRREKVEERKVITPVRELKIERLFGRMHHLQQMLDRFLACRPTGAAKNSRMVLVALYPLVRESFQLYADMCEMLAVLLDRFFDMEYHDCGKAFEAYSNAAKQIDELAAFYNWCKDIGVARSSEYPQVQKITDKLLETLEEFMRDRSGKSKSPERPREATPAPPVPGPPPQEEEKPVEQDMSSIKALPAPSDFKPRQAEPPKKQETADLLNLAEDAPSADAQANKFALALFSGPPDKQSSTWEAFPDNSGEEVTSAWQTPLAETGKADWELALVESASNLSKQKATLAGGFDPLLLDGMYDQGASRQVMSTYTSAGGSSSSVALPNPDKLKTGLLALPAPTGTPVAEGLQDPFAASLTVPPPSYVQMAEIEKKQQMLVQEQMMWQQYARDGMQGQLGLAKIGGAAPTSYVPYGMPGMLPANGLGYVPYPYAPTPY